ncbi:MAG: hypothetical protein SCJ97_01710 [Bacillota bacterium]|jgi:hypothetical protein|nr:hypothetical protein [Bacillota bacterium]
MSSEKYINEIVKDLELAFWDERGRGARYRTTLVGVNYFKEKYGTGPADKSWEKTIDNVIDILIKEDIISKAEYNGKGNELIVEFFDCTHLDVEKGLAEKGIPPFSCPCANLVMHYIDSLIGSNSELVSVDLHDNKCVVTIGIVGSTLEEV